MCHLLDNSDQHEAKDSNKSYELKLGLHTALGLLGFPSCCQRSCHGCVPLKSMRQLPLHWKHRPMCYMEAGEGESEDLGNCQRQKRRNILKFLFFSGENLNDHCTVGSWLSNNQTGSSWVHKNTKRKNTTGDLALNLEKTLTCIPYLFPTLHSILEKWGTEHHKIYYHENSLWFKKIQFCPLLSIIKVIPVYDSNLFSNCMEEC